MRNMWIRATQGPSPQPVSSYLPPFDPTRPGTAADFVRAHDLRRRHRLVNVLALGLMIATVVLIPSALLPSFNPATLAALGIVFLSTSLAYLLSRSGRVTAGGYAIVVGLALAVAFEIVGKSMRPIQGGLDLSDLRIFDLFALPIVLSAVLVDRRGTVIIATLTSAFTVAAFILLSKTATMQAYWDARYPVPGSAVDAISVAIVAQGLIAVAAWLGADSVRRALYEGTRADEAAAANERLAAQTVEIEAQRRRLRGGISRIQQVHAAVASGRWDVRAPLEEGELLPLATSLNLLLDRLVRMGREQGERDRIEAAARQVAEALRRVRTGQGYLPPPYTGTAQDEVLVELSTVLRDMLPGAGRVAPTHPPVAFGQHPGADHVQSQQPQPPYGAYPSYPSYPQSPAAPSQYQWDGMARQAQSPEDGQAYLPPWLTGGWE